MVLQSSEAFNFLFAILSQNTDCILFDPLSDHADFFISAPPTHACTETYTHAGDAHTFKKNIEKERKKIHFVTNLKAIFNPNSLGAHSGTFSMAVGGTLLMFTII